MDTESFRRATIGLSLATYALLLGEYLIQSLFQCPGYTWWVGLSLIICLMPLEWRLKYSASKWSVIIVTLLQSIFIGLETRALITKVLPNIGVTDQVVFITTLVVFGLSAVSLYFYTKGLIEDEKLKGELDSKNQSLLPK